jgi:hypothetical protein
LAEIAEQVEFRRRRQECALGVHQVEFVEHNEGAHDARGVDVVQSVGQAVGPAEKSAQHLVVRRDDDPATVEEPVVWPLARLERHEGAFNLVAPFVLEGVEAMPQRRRSVLGLPVHSLGQGPERQRVDEPRGTPLPAFEEEWRQDSPCLARTSGRPKHDVMPGEQLGCNPHLVVIRRPAAGQPLEKCPVCRDIDSHRG